MRAATPFLCLVACHGGWVLTFEDQFLGTAVNTTSWTIANRDPTKSQYDGHDAMFVSDNVAVANGNRALCVSLVQLVELLHSHCAVARLRGTIRSDHYYNLRSELDSQRRDV